MVAPQTDPKAIRLSFEGADKVEVDGQGDLLLRVADKELRMRKPVVYQEKDGVKQEIAENTRSRVSARSVSRSRLTTRPGRGH